MRKKELMGRLIKEDAVTAVVNLIQEDRPVTMDEVAQRCGVAKGTLYNYFKNKKGLITYVHETMIHPLKKSSHKMVGTSAGPWEKIRAFVDTVFDFHREYPLYFKFIQSERSAAEAIRERNELTIRPLAEVCREGIRTKVFVQSDPWVMAAMVFGTVIGPLQSWEERNAPLPDMNTLKQDMINLLNGMLLKKKEKLR